MFSKETKNFFIDLVQSTMKNQEEHKIIRPDMIHLLMEAKKGRLTHDIDVGNGKSDANVGFATVEESEVGKKLHIKRQNTHLYITAWSDNDLTAQAVLFFAAAFETVSTVMSFALYELAEHTDVQERLVKEVKEHNVKHGGKLDLTSIQNLTYMDMVVSGSRFALCELKMLLYQTLMNFEISPTEKTCIPAKLSTDTFNLRLEGGHGLNFRTR